METIQDQPVLVSECDVCGGNHQTEYCPELGLADPGTVLEFVSRARLTLPDTMQLIEIMDDSGSLGVCSKIPIPPKTQLGPFEAKRTSSDIEANDFFILKMFNKDGSVTCFDSSDENECNWMCLIRPADTEEEQNCMAYTINHNVFYSTTRDILPTEELRVWYAPHYAKKLGREPKPNGTTRSMLGAMVVTEQPDDLPIKEEPSDEGYPTANNLGDGVVKIEAIHECDTCSEKFSNESDFAKHIRSHLIPETRRGPFQCKKCPNKYRYVRKLQEHMLTHAKQHACSVCNFKANSEPNLKFHMDTKHSELTPEEREKGIKSQNVDNSNSASFDQESNSSSADVDIKEAAEGMMSLIKSAASKVEDKKKPESDTQQNQESGQNGENLNENRTEDAQQSEENEEKPVKKKRGRKPLSETKKEAPKPKPPFLGTVMIKVEPPDPDCPPARVLPKRTLKGRRTTGKFADSEEEIFSPTKVKVEKPENGEYDAAKRGRGRPKKSESSVQNAQEKELKSPKSVEPENDIAPEEIDEYLDDEAADVDFQPSEEQTKELEIEDDDEISEEDEDDVQPSDDSFDLDEDYKAPKRRGRKRKFRLPLSPHTPGKKSKRGRKQRDKSFQEDLQELEEATVVTEDDDGNVYYKCGSCGKKYSQMTYLRLHLPAHTDRFKCSECGKRFTRNESYQKHRCKVKSTIYYIKEKTAEDEPDIFCCAVCKKEFSEENFVIKHYDVHSSNFKCKICQTVFEKEEDYNTHDQSTCSAGLEKKFQCALCKQSFNNDMSLYRHMAMHTDLYKCDKCGKCYSRKDSWQGHILRCNPDKIDDHKIYVCHNCKKTFATELGAKNHMVSCAKHYCSNCRTAFESEEILKNHECNKDNVDPNLAVQFQCATCKKTFSSFTYLKRHEASHEGAFQCDICNRGFSRREELSSHYRYCLGVQTIKKEGKIACDVCEVTFVDAREYRNHIQEHTHPHKCETCLKRFIKIGTLHNHKCESTNDELTEGKSDPCKVCGKIFKSKSRLQRHEILHEEPRFECDTCGKKFYRRDYVRDHVCMLENGVKARIIRKKNKVVIKDDVVCHECGKSFNNVSNLNKHVKTHGEKQYSCDVCGKMFHYEAYVRTHKEMVHEKKFSFQCTHCGKILTSKTGLICHIRQFHTENPPEYKCPTCNRGFKQRGNLRTHMLMHGSAKNYGCDICGQYFKYPEQRNRHRLEHTMTDKFTCHVCQKTFVRRYDLKRHVADMHSGHVYICCLCNERCSHRPTVIRHFRRKHPNNMHMVRDAQYLESMKKNVGDLPVAVKQVKQEKDATLLYEAVQQLEQAGLVESGQETTYITHLDNGEDIILPQEAAEALQGLSNAVITTNQMGEETITIPSSIQSALGGDGPNGEQTVVILQIINPEDQEDVEEEVVDSNMIQYIETEEGIPEGGVPQEAEITVDGIQQEEGINPQVEQGAEVQETDEGMVHEGVTGEGEEATVMEIPSDMQLQIQEVQE